MCPQLIDTANYAYDADGHATKTTVRSLRTLTPAGMSRELDTAQSTDTQTPPALGDLTATGTVLTWTHDGEQRSFDTAAG